jgi:hypothetical protein
MEDDFEISDLTERDMFHPLYYGPRGVKWLHFDDVIDKNNLLMFTCSYCRVTSNRLSEKQHEKGCRNLLMNLLGM